MTVVASAAGDILDPTYYPEDDGLGEHELQTLIRELLRPLLARFLAEQGVVAHAGSDQFLYWVKHRPTESVSPDIYVLPGVPQNIVIGSWKVWEHDFIAPSFALEVVSDEWAKDYRDNPRKYGELGTQELVLFDPIAYAGDAPRTPERIAWHVFRRHGRWLECVERSGKDRVQSQSLGCWLRAVGELDTLRLRLGLGATGDELFPTEEEHERAEKERERAAKERLQLRLIEMEAELRRLQK
jgi:Uma2 family endonuclease